MNRIGERFKTNEGFIAIIVDYKNYNNVFIVFEGNEDMIPKKVRMNALKDGRVLNPFKKSVYNIGYVGQGDYIVYKDGRTTKYYDDWHSLMQRGFDEEFKIKYSTYKDVIVNPECYCLQDFGKWFDENYYEIEGEHMCLDKDILVKGNKEYRFDRMIYVPSRINSLFTKSNATRGDCPIGVCYNKENGKYKASCSIIKNNRKIKKHIGYYNTPHEAFLAYKEFKEAYIKQVADEYKGRIPDRLYEAMYRWEVEEDD